MLSPGKRMCQESVEGGYSLVVPKRGFYLSAASIGENAVHINGDRKRIKLGNAPRSLAKTTSSS